MWFWKEFFKKKKMGVMVMSGVEWGEVGGVGLCSPGVWVLFLVLPLTICVILGKTLNLLEYQFPHLKNGKNNSIYLRSL